MTLTAELREVPLGRPTRLRNVVCPYCGTSLTKKSRTKEHVIGRKFVPKATLENSWNLILNACVKCNGHKSDLEDDISAITMQPDVLGRHFSDHPQLAQDATRKAARAFSRETGKLVSESTPALEIKGQLAPGLNLTFDFVGQPQVAEHRAFELARLQFQAHFYWITYSHQQNRGWWWKGVYAPILVVSKNDWGNDVAMAFMRNTQGWEHRVLLAGAADGHFNLAIRRNPDVELWSLAVEWNENYRILAACGEEPAIKKFAESIPKLEMTMLSQSARSGLGFRVEKALAEADDTLFAPPG